MSFGGLSGGTATRVLFSSGLGILTDDADFTFSTDTLTVTKIATTTFTGAPLGSTGIDIGAQATPFRDLYLHSGGTFGSHSFRLTGTPTGHRVITFPDATTTLAGLGTTNIFTQPQRITMANASLELTATSGDAFITMNGPSFPGFTYNKTQTPDTLTINTGSTITNHVNLAEGGDQAFDFGTPCHASSTCTDPILVVRSHNQNTTDYRGYAYYGSAGKAVKALTAGVATSTLRINVAASTGTGGRVFYTVFAADAVDQQSRSGWVQVSISNKAGTEICKMTSVAGADDTSIDQTEDGSGIGAISSGTLTYAVTCDLTPTNGVDIQINAVSSLTETTLDAYSSIVLVGPGEVQPQ